MLSFCIAGAQIILELANITVNVMDNATFTCSAMAYPTSMIKWFRQLENGSLQLLTNTSTKYSVTALSSETMNQTSELTVMNVTILDVGSYVCQANSGATTDTSSAMLSEFICNHSHVHTYLIYFPQVYAMKAASD